MYVEIPHSFSRYNRDEHGKLIEVNFPKYPDIFSKLSRVLYVGIGDDIDGLVELAQKHSYVVGIDTHICNDPTHFHNQYSDFLKRRNEMLQQYPNLHIKEMDARKLDFSSGCFDGVIFKRSFGFMGGNTTVNYEKNIKSVLNEIYCVLCDEGLVWIIYAETDIIDLTLDRMKSLLKFSGFETIEDSEDYMMCRKRRMLWKE